jgi:hypothetical protein
MLIGLSGYARSGKDATAELLCLNYEFTRSSFADPMRDAMYRLNPLVDEGLRLADLVDDYGWDVAKGKDEARRLLQVFGTEVGREMFGHNFWIEQAFKQIDPAANVVIADVRFPNEADAIKARGGTVIRINRHNLTAVNSHKSEHALDNYMFDHVIYNDGTLDDLADNVFMLMRSAFKL